MPILFILFMVLLFKILNRENKRNRLKIQGYIDDGLLISIAISENKAIVKLEKIFVIAKK